MSEHKAERKGMWALPGLRAFAPPVEAPVGERGKNTTEIVPWELPGTQLRTNPRAAARGFYSPTGVGAPTTTRQAEILNTALIGPPTGTKGVVNGRDVLSRTSIAHDPVTAYNASPREVSSPNTVVMGDVGAGKSSFVKTVCVLRPLLLQGRRAVIFDKRIRPAKANTQTSSAGTATSPSALPQTGAAHASTSWTR